MAPLTQKLASDMAAAAAKMALDPRANDSAYNLAPAEPAAPDPASPTGIAQAVVALLSPTLTEAVEIAVQDLQAYGQRINHAEDRISSLEDEVIAQSTAMALIS